MIKVIVFDYVGVLVREKNIILTDVEDKLERHFGKNYSDKDYLNSVRDIEPDANKALSIAEGVIDNLYEIKDNSIFEKIKEKYPNIIICIATNHISYIEKHIQETMDIKYIDKIFVSAKLNKVKPKLDFYMDVIDYYKFEPDEFLFVDDNQENIVGASLAKMCTLKIDRNDDVYKKVIERLDDK